LKISFQEGTAPVPEGTAREDQLKARFDYMESMGIVGFEPGGRGLSRRVNEFKDALKGRNIKISAICAGFQGWILAEEEKQRELFDTTMREIIASAGELGSTGVIFVPAFNGQKPSLPHTQETRDFMCEQLNKLGNYAVQCGTTIILEPLNRREAFYLRQVGDAASICRDINNKGVTCMGDFWHMTWEEASDYGAFTSAGKYLQHVHIASRKGRNMPGEDGEADNYIEGFKALKLLEYPHYVSFECNPKKGADRNIVLPAAVQLMRDQWKAAII
jgi:sugar phosphate isomerase/epimerase